MLGIDTPLSILIPGTWPSGRDCIGYRHTADTEVTHTEGKGTQIVVKTKVKFALRLPSSLNSQSYYFNHCHGCCSLLLWGRQRDPSVPSASTAPVPAQAGDSPPELACTTSLGTWAPPESGGPSPTPVTRWSSSLALVQIPPNCTESTLTPLGSPSCNLLHHLRISFFFLSLQWVIFTMNTNRDGVKRCCFDTGTKSKEITFGAQYMDSSAPLP